MGQPIDMNATWHSVPLIVLDLETSGPNPETAVPCEVAVARFEGGELVGSWSTLLNPGAPLSAEVITIHGITDAMVADAPPAAGFALGLAPPELLDGAYPCGYNGQHYDRTILARLAASELAKPEDLLRRALLVTDWLDPLVYIRDIDGLVKGERGRHKLAAACERRGIANERAHRALGDCIATGKLLWSLRDRLGDITLGELVRRTVARGRIQKADLDRHWGRPVHGQRI